MSLHHFTQFCGMLVRLWAGCCMTWRWKMFLHRERFSTRYSTGLYLWGMRLSPVSGLKVSVPESATLQCLTNFNVFHIPTGTHPCGTGPGFFRRNFMRPDLNTLPGDSGCSVWFYDGMSQPRLLAGSIAGLLTDVTITSNYRGDVTSEIHDVVQEWLATGRGNLADLKEELWYYNLYINPSADELMNANRRYGLGHTTRLKGFINNAA